MAGCSHCPLPGGPMLPWGAHGCQPLPASPRPRPCFCAKPWQVALGVARPLCMSPPQLINPLGCPWGRVGVPGWVRGWVGSRVVGAGGSRLEVTVPSAHRCGPLDGGHHPRPGHGRWSPPVTASVGPTPPSPWPPKLPHCVRPAPGAPRAVPVGSPGPCPAATHAGAAGRARSRFPPAPRHISRGARSRSRAVRMSQEGERRRKTRTAELRRRVSHCAQAQRGRGRLRRRSAVGRVSGGRALRRRIA